MQRTHLRNLKDNFFELIWAVLNNDENVMKINDHHVAKQFSKAFEKMWEKYVDVESGV